MVSSKCKTCSYFCECSLFAASNESSYENSLNYNLSKINKVPNRLNKRISSIVIGYNRIKYKMLW